MPAALGQALPDLGDASQSELSPLQEKRIGESIMREIRADAAYSDDAEVSDYLNSIGGRLAAASPESRQPFEFFLVANPQVNAFALPGGYIGVNAGLILNAQSEGELAGVLSHEIAHVVQRHFSRMLAAQRSSQITSLAALVIGILASRVSGDLAQAAIVGSQANLVQNALNFSRAHEQEADRVGFQILEKAGFDAQGMAGFFERLSRLSRFESAAPSYLRTHPLTTDRIADMQNRAQNLPYRQVPDSLEFQLTRAKIRALQDSPGEAVAFFEESLKARKYLSETASRYGLVAALVRAQAGGRAVQELALMRKSAPPTAMMETLAARAYRTAGNNAAAAQTYRDALRQYPGNRALIYDFAEMLLQVGQPEEALRLVESRLQNAQSDFRLYQLQARCYAALKRFLPQHRALAESYFHQGNIPAAIEQLMLAQKSGDGDFYQQSSVDARLRQLRVLDQENRPEIRK